MRTLKPRPWLTATGVEIPTAQLREICKSWDANTWERYLKWYESGRREALVTPGVYKKRGEDLTKSIFEEFNQSPTPEQQKFCRELLGSLEPREAKVLRLTFFEGRTQREIGAEMGISQPRVFQLKNKAISALRRGHDGEKLFTRRFMRGEISEAVPISQSPLMQPLSLPIREERVYDPKKYKEELANIKHSALRLAMTELSEREQRILYLRFWCDFSISEIARELRSGVNLIEQVSEAALSKLKRKIIRIETGYESGEGPSCA